MQDPKATKHGYKFQRVFTDGEFLGAGLLIIPPGEKKPLKPAKDNTYVITSRAPVESIMFMADLLITICRYYSATKAQSEFSYIVQSFPLLKEGSFSFLGATRTKSTILPILTQS